MTKRAALAAILGMVVVLSGCTGTDIVTDLGRATAEKACGTDYLGSAQVQQGIAIPRDFVPVAATRCTFVSENTPDGHPQRVRVEQRADGDLTALVTALKEKTGYPAKGECTMIERLAVVVTLVNEAGLHVTPTAPTHGCGDAFASVLMAVAQLSWTEVSRTPLAESQVGPGTQCPNVSQPVVATAVATGPPLFPDGTYMIGVLLRPRRDRRGRRPSSDYNGLGGPDLKKLRTAVTGSRPVAGTCDRPQPNTVLIYSYATRRTRA